MSESREAVLNYTNFPVQFQMIRLHQEIDNSQPHQRNIKKMMEALVTYEVLCQFSWSGKSAINGRKNVLSLL